MTIIEDLKHLIKDERNFITNASNFSSLIFNNIDNLNWVGFYMISGEELILGPFQGKPACLRIQINKGVCGKSASIAETIVVDDVHDFEGHIACDSASNSEIVVPIIINSKVIGVLDIDSPIKNRFGLFEKELFERMLDILIVNSDMESIYAYYNN